MKTTLAVLTGLLLAPSAAQAQPGGQLGSAPTFKVVASTDKAKGSIVFRERLYKHVPVIREVVEIVNGQQVKKTVTTYETVAEERLIEINAANSRIITPDGKQLPIDEVWKRLKANTVVVVSADSSTPAAPYLRALSAETLIIIPGPTKK